jgi:uncharacterized membrane protein YadS
MGLNLGSVLYGISLQAITVIKRGFNFFLKKVDNIAVSLVIFISKK